MKTPITWYGGKQLMLKHILPIIPEHKVYTETFFGGGAVYFSKEPAKCEVINDRNREAMNFYQVTQSGFEDLQVEIASTLHSHASYNDAKIVYTYPHLFTDKKRAWAFYTMANQSFSANMSTFAFDKGGKTTATINNKKHNFADSLRERLESTIIENDDAIKVIKRYDSNETFHYIDPPYFNSDCGHYKGYTEADFIQLLETCAKLEGRFLLSSYPSDILKAYQKKFKWHVIEVEKAVRVTKHTKKTKVEVLTANYKL